MIEIVLSGRSWAKSTAGLSSLTSHSHLTWKVLSCYFCSHFMEKETESGKGYILGSRRQHLSPDPLDNQYPWLLPNFVGGISRLFAGHCPSCFNTNSHLTHAVTLCRQRLCFTFVKDQLLTAQFLLMERKMVRAAGEEKRERKLLF